MLKYNSIANKDNNNPTRRLSCLTFLPARLQIDPLPRCLISRRGTLVLSKGFPFHRSPVSKGAPRSFRRSVSTSHRLCNLSGGEATKTDAFTPTEQSTQIDYSLKSTTVSTITPAPAIPPVESTALSLYRGEPDDSTATRLYKRFPWLKSITSTFQNTSRRICSFFVEDRWPRPSFIGTALYFGLGYALLIICNYDWWAVSTGEINLFGGAISGATALMVSAAVALGINTVISNLKWIRALPWYFRLPLTVLCTSTVSCFAVNPLISVLADISDWTPVSPTGIVNTTVSRNPWLTIVVAAQTPEAAQDMVDAVIKRISVFDPAAADRLQAIAPQLAAAAQDGGDALNRAAAEVIFAIPPVEEPPKWPRRFGNWLYDHRYGLTAGGATVIAAVTLIIYNYGVGALLTIAEAVQAPFGRLWHGNPAVAAAAPNMQLVVYQPHVLAPGAIVLGYLAKGGRFLHRMVRELITPSYHPFVGEPIPSIAPASFTSIQQYRGFAAQHTLPRLDACVLENRVCRPGFWNNSTAAYHFYSEQLRCLEKNLLSTNLAEYIQQAQFQAKAFTEAQKGVVTTLKSGVGVEPCLTQLTEQLTSYRSTLNDLTVTTCRMVNTLEVGKGAVLRAIDLSSANPEVRRQLERDIVVIHQTENLQNHQSLIAVDDALFALARYRTGAIGPETLLQKLSGVWKQHPGVSASFYRILHSMETTSINVQTFGDVFPPGMDQDSLKRYAGDAADPATWSATQRALFDPEARNLSFSDYRGDPGLNRAASAAQVLRQNELFLSSDYLRRAAQGQYNYVLGLTKEQFTFWWASERPIDAAYREEATILVRALRHAAEEVTRTEDLFAEVLRSNPDGAESVFTLSIPPDAEAASSYVRDYVTNTGSTVRVARSLNADELRCKVSKEILQNIRNAWGNDVCTEEPQRRSFQLSQIDSLQAMIDRNETLRSIDRFLEHKMPITSPVPSILNASARIEDVGRRYTTIEQALDRPLGLGHSAPQAGLALKPDALYDFD